MQRRALTISCAAAMVVTSPPTAFAIESQLIDEVRELPAEIDRAFPCGSWSADDGQGYYRVVIASVYGGAGSETYVQRIRTPAADEQKLTLVETVSFPQLNDDHSQYSVVAARCVRSGRSSFVELTADFEHDVGDVQHRIRIELKAPYRVTNRRVRPR